MLVQPAATLRSYAIRKRISVRGVVQGVGFRPFVYGQAKALGLRGWVSNTTAGVVIEAEGQTEHVLALIDALRTATPINAMVTAVEALDIALCGEDNFTIRASKPGGGASTHILPDIATCPVCIAELFDPTNRRHRYPFITCTHCGPRYTIMESVPYDRARTAMRHFQLCAACLKEYGDPSDRRFHAETTACLACGPRLSLWDKSGRILSRDDDALLAVAAALRRGIIVAIKGIGGFHLVVDARDEAAVQRLRNRKRREEKPFAVMFPSMAVIRAACHVAPAEEALLTGPAQPIGILRRSDNDVVTSAVAPHNPWLGAMLPYSPLHHLLLGELGFPVVATSGNVSDEPIVIDESEVTRRLSGIADLFLVHDRPILRPVDDSVARIVCGRELIVRCARGLSPTTIEVKGVGEGILAVGGHVKTTIALSQDDAIVLGPHIGDLETVEARSAHRNALDDITHLNLTNARIVAHDLHPDYGSTRAVEGLNLPAVPVQHHLAHVVGCMADNDIDPPVLGVAWDGTGYGVDGTIWGGEFLAVTDTGWNRVAHLRPFCLPGGAAAAREPRRAALGLLYEAYGEDAFAMRDLPPLAAFARHECDLLRTMLVRQVNAPLCSSIGRLFDAFAALCGLRQGASYEGRAAMELEWAADGSSAGHAYVFPLRETGHGAPLVMDWRPALDSALADIRAGATPGAISAALHNGLAEAIVNIARAISIPRVALTGGCFQNARLTEASVAALSHAGFQPLWHRRIPPNDGGIALGQAVWAAWMQNRGAVPCA